MSHAVLLDAVAARLAEDPAHVEAVLRLIADPDAVPERASISSRAAAVNIARQASRRGDFVAGAHRGDQVREMLGSVSRQALSQRVRARRLLALRIGNNSWFPDWQFDAEGQVLPGLGDVLDRLPADALAADLLMRAALPEEGGSCPAELLAAGNAALAAHYVWSAGGER